MRVFRALFSVLGGGLAAFVAVFALLALVALAPPARAEPTSLSGTLPAAPATPPAAEHPADHPAEEEAPDSPRASMRTYIDLCERGRYEEASRYLDLPRGAEKRAGELARKLEVVLAERLWVNPEQLSPLAQGRTVDGLPPGTEELGKVRDAKAHPVAIRLVRHESRSPEDEARWVFSQSTVQQIDALYSSLENKWVREHLPAPLLAQGPLSLYYWQWLALPALGMLSVAVGRIFAWLSTRVATGLLQRWPLSRHILARLERPMTLGWALAASWAVLPHLALTLRAEDLTVRVLHALGYLAFFWGLLRAVSIAGDEMAEGDWARARPSVRSLSAIGVRLGKVIVATLALMVALTELGYPVTSVVAGLGIGGVALALAAQKTGENLFGSVAILVDQPFRVGDTIKIDGAEGTVESIGLRSTRLRTLDRTLVIVPNGKLADMRIESFGSRDRIRFATKVPLARDTRRAEVEAVVEAIKKRLLEHERVRKEDVFVRLSGLGEQSFDVDVAAPVETVDFAEFAKVRQELLLACIDAVEEAGAHLAVPTRVLIGAKA